MRVLDLFSGIGGFSLGLARAGMRTTAFCEIEEYPRSILRKHWPEVPIFEDVRELHATDLPEAVDLICGGYPCQPFSVAGKREGKDDERHLWPEIIRLVRELGAGKPDWCIFENVAGHVSMGLDTVLSDLEGEGYSCRTFIIPACAVNAPHRRDRVWIVAHAECKRAGSESGKACDEEWRTSEDRRTGLRQTHGETCTGGIEPAGSFLSDTERERHSGRGLHGHSGAGKWPIRENEQNNGNKIRSETSTCGNDIRHDATHTSGTGRQKRNITAITDQQGHGSGGGNEDDAKFRPTGFTGQLTEWITLPGVRARNDGLSQRVARLKALGNSVVPQIPELIGRAIMAATQGMLF